MVGFELRGAIVILIIALIFLNMLTYKEVWKEQRSYLWGFISISPGSMPTKYFWLLLLATFALFTFGLYLNEQPPIILF